MIYQTLDEQVRHEAEEQGIKEGIEQGIKEGILLGEKRRSEKIYQKLVKSGMNEKEAYKLAFED